MLSTKFNKWPKAFQRIRQSPQSAKKKLERKKFKLE